MIALVNANTLHIPLADSSVNMIATSPPFYALRDYQVSGQIGLEQLHDCLAWACGEPPCSKCYVCVMRLVAKELWRVLHPTGTLWLNLGDSYSGSGKARGNGGVGPTSGKQLSNRGAYFDNQTPVNFQGLKPKDLCMIPARVALALQADGWTLRSDIIWNKPNPMPESIQDRPTKAHEYLFLLTKNMRYFYDINAIAEAQTSNGEGGFSNKQRLKSIMAGQPHAPSLVNATNDGQRNRRSVWTITSQSYSGAHFATWPEALVNIMIRAGTSEKGVCKECGKQWERILTERSYPKELANARRAHSGIGNNLGGQRHQDWINENPRSTLGWQPSCSCNASLIPATVLDPFCGSGTTGVVAQRLGRSFIGLDLSYSYLNEQAKQRIADALRDTGETHTIDTDNGKLTQPSIFATMNT